MIRPTPPDTTEFVIVQQIMGHVRSAIRLTAHLCGVDLGPGASWRYACYRSIYEGLLAMHAVILQTSLWCIVRFNPYAIPPVPFIRACRVCGCTEDDACPSCCSWYSDDLCSVCAAFLHIHADPVDSIPDPFATAEEI